MSQQKKAQKLSRFLLQKLSNGVFYEISYRVTPQSSGTAETCNGFQRFEYEILCHDTPLGKAS